MTTPVTGPDLDHLIGRALPRLRQATGVSGAIGGPVSCGGRRLVITNLDTMLTSVFRGQVIRPGMGVSGRALQLGRPVAVNNYFASTGITHPLDGKMRQEHIHGVFAVPVYVGADLRAGLAGGLRSGESFGDRVLDTAVPVSAALGRELAIELEVTRRLRIVEEFRRREEPRPAVDLREIHEELLSIARATADEPLRERLHVLCDRLRPPSGHGGPTASQLTDRERQVLAEVALGRTNIEVAEQLAVMPTTVKSYLKNAMRKLGTRNRMETIRAAREVGLID
jgi:LuxR family transcriptional regulator, regulator of acetate metabolism